MSMDDVTALTGLEDLRCQALLHHDEALLRSVVAPDVLHVHGTGMVQRGDEYFGYALSAFYRLTERGPLVITVHDQLAIMVGPLALTVRKTEADDVTRLNGVAGQLWLRGGPRGWRQATFQLTPLISS